MDGNEFRDRVENLIRESGLDLSTLLTAMEAYSQQMRDAYEVVERLTLKAKADA